MKQTARNSTNDLHRRFFATIITFTIYDAYTCAPLSLSLILDPRAPNFPRSSFGFFDSTCVQVILLVTRGKKRERDSQFERKKETKTNRYRGIGLVWPYIQRVSSGWDRWLMHSREDGMEILSRSGGSRRRRRRSSSFRLRCSSVRLARIGWKRRDGKEG